MAELLSNANIISLLHTILRFPQFSILHTGFTLARNQSETCRFQSDSFAVNLERPVT